MQDDDASGSVLTLLEHPLSPYVQKVLIMLREKDVPFERVSPQFSAEIVNTKRPSDVNPRAEIPVLMHGGDPIFDSTIILEYLEETFPAPPMMPAASAMRARVRMIEEICDTQWEAANWGLGEIKFFKRGGEVLEPVLNAAAEADIASLHAWLEGMLGDEAWLTGDRFGWGDLSALPYVAMTEMFGISPPSGSRVEDWLRRGLARPSVAATIGEARASTAGLENGERILKSGVLKRQYRDHRLEWMIRSGGLQVVVDGLANKNIRFSDLSRFATHGD